MSSDDCIDNDYGQYSPDVFVLQIYLILQVMDQTVFMLITSDLEKSDHYHYL